MLFQQNKWGTPKAALQTSRAGTHVRLPAAADMTDPMGLNMPFKVQICQGKLREI